MSQFESIPNRSPAETAQEGASHFAIPGFELLAPEQQGLFLRFSGAQLDQARPVIEREIAKIRESQKVGNDGQADTFRADNLKTSATSRETQANTAIDTFRRA